MAFAFDKKRTRRFVLPSDKELPEKDHTVWHLAPLSQSEMEELTEIGEDVNKSAVDRLREVLKRTLVGWENFKMADGNDAEFKKDPDGRPSDETLRLIGPRDMIQLVNEINAKEALTPAEAGKS